MLFHSHPVNDAREAAGEPTVNSVWFWGGGVLPDALDPVFAGVWGDDPLARGLARASGVAWASLPESAEHWLAQASEGEHVLVLNPAREIAAIRWRTPSRNGSRLCSERCGDASSQCCRC